MLDSLYMICVSLLPRKRIGRWMGALAGWKGSSVISHAAVRWFAGWFHLNMQEAEAPIEAYENLSQLFVRRLKAGARPIDPDPTTIVSPVDGVMSESGVIEGTVCTQVKGRTFTVDELLGGGIQGAPFHGGHWMTIYLSPRHYHRIHSPVKGDVVRFHHIPGHLWPVNAPSVRAVDRLFAVNERLISYVRHGGREIAVVKVGAIGVGRISLSYSDAVTNCPNQLERMVTLDPPHGIEKGGELGAFELGSTVIVVFPPGMVRLEGIPVGEETKLGQRIATFLPDA